MLESLPAIYLMRRVSLDLERLHIIFIRMIPLTMKTKHGAMRWLPTGQWTTPIGQWTVRSM